jgi:hypothetical protein
MRCGGRIEIGTPIGQRDRCVCAHAKYDIAEPISFAYTPGRGILARVDDCVILVGKSALAYTSIRRQQAALFNSAFGRLLTLRRDAEEIVPRRMTGVSRRQDESARNRLRS